MMKKAVLAAGLIISLVAVVAAAGCVMGDPIVGKWQTPEGFLGAQATLVFNSDGTGTYQGSFLGLTSANPSKFTWKKGEGSLYTIVYEGTDNLKDASVYFSDDKKSMKFDNVDYNRV